MKIIALGSELRGDDALGVVAAKKIKENIPCLEVYILRDSAKLIDHFSAEAEVILIDCLRVEKGSELDQKNSILRVDLLQESLQGVEFTLSSHGFDLPSLLELARNLGIAPAKLVLLGIAGESFTLGAPLSLRLSLLVDELCRKVIHEAGAQ